MNLGICIYIYISMNLKESRGYMEELELEGIKVIREILQLYCAFFVLFIFHAGLICIALAALKLTL